MMEKKYFDIRSVSRRMLIVSGALLPGNGGAPGVLEGLEGATSSPEVCARRHDGLRGSGRVWKGLTGAEVLLL